MSGDQLGPLLLVGGLALAALGAVIWLGGLDWFGRLPGDLRYEGESTRIYVPITSMIVISAALSGVLWVVGRLLGD